MPEFKPVNRLAGAAEMPHDRATNADADPAASTDGHSEQTGPAAADRLWDDWRDLRDQASWYLAARGDQLKLSLRQLVLALVLGLLGGIAGSAVLVVSAGVLVMGIAGGLGELFGGRLWLGELITGLAILIIAAGAAYAFVRRLTRTSRWKTINRYAELHKQRNSRPPHQPVGE